MGNDSCTLSFRADHSALYIARILLSQPYKGFKQGSGKVDGNLARLKQFNATIIDPKSQISIVKFQVNPFDYLLI